MKTNKTWTKRNAPADVTVRKVVYKYTDGSRKIELVQLDGSTFSIVLSAEEAKSLANDLM